MQTIILDLDPVIPFLWLPLSSGVPPYCWSFCLCGAMRSALAWSRLHWVECLCLDCVIVGRHIGSGAAWWLPWEPSNIPRQMPEMAIKKNFTLLFFTCHLALAPNVVWRVTSLFHVLLCHLSPVSRLSLLNFHIYILCVLCHAFVVPLLQDLPSGSQHSGSLSCNWFVICNEAHVFHILSFVLGRFSHLVHNFFVHSHTCCLYYRIGGIVGGVLGLLLVIGLSVCIGIWCCVKSGKCVCVQVGSCKYNFQLHWFDHIKRDAFSTLFHCFAYGQHSFSTHLWLTRLTFYVALSQYHVIAKVTLRLDCPAEFPLSAVPKILPPLVIILRSLGQFC